MINIKIIQLGGSDEPLIYRCPFCLYTDMEFILNSTGNNQSRCKACYAMGPTTASEQFSKNHLKDIFKSLHGVSMKEWKPKEKL